MTTKPGRRSATTPRTSTSTSASSSQVSTTSSSATRPTSRPKDKALNAPYRTRYDSATGKYALSVPFMELFFRLAIRGEQGRPAGYVGQITSNSFMKREFGKKLIEDLFAGHDIGNPVDLTAVIDTSGAYIPGHGTPTVIIVGRRRRPVARPGPRGARCPGRARPASKTPSRDWCGPRSSSTSISRATTAAS